MKRFVLSILLIGDALALLLFAYLGRRAHGLIDETWPAIGVLITAAEFTLPWVIVAWLLGAYPRGEVLSWSALLGRALNAWLIAAPLGVLARAGVLGQAVIPVSFLIAALGFGGVILLSWRMAFALIWRMMTSPRAQEQP
ncbi:MAG: DUF3054 domain-containing protein [Anaerolineae bacterium]|nr:DUF3054 domain-containing protein [Anaerolineae bacterium]